MVRPVERHQRHPVMRAVDEHVALCPRLLIRRCPLPSCPLSAASAMVPPPSAGNSRRVTRVLRSKVPRVSGPHRAAILWAERGKREAMSNDATSEHDFTFVIRAEDRRADTHAALRPARQAQCLHGHRLRRADRRGSTKRPPIPDVAVCVHHRAGAGVLRRGRPPRRELARRQRRVRRPLQPDDPCPGHVSQAPHRRPSTGWPSVSAPRCSCTAIWW